jgi:hypothetical protein
MNLALNVTKSFAKIALCSRYNFHDIFNRCIGEVESAIHEAYVWACFGSDGSSSSFPYPAMYFAGHRGAI